MHASISDNLFLGPRNVSRYQKTPNEGIVRDFFFFLLIFESRSLPAATGISSSSIITTPAITDSEGLCLKKKGLQTSLYDFNS